MQELDYVGTKNSQGTNKAKVTWTSTLYAGEVQVNKLQIAAVVP